MERAVKHRVRTQWLPQRSCVIRRSMMMSTVPTESMRKSTFTTSSMSPGRTSDLGWWSPVVSVSSVFTLVVVRNSSSARQRARSTTFMVYSPDSDILSVLRFTTKTHQVSDSSISIVWSDPSRTFPAQVSAHSAQFSLSQSLFPVRKYEVWSRSNIEKNEKEVRRMMLLQQNKKIREPGGKKVTVELWYTEPEADGAAKMNTHHVPLRQSVEEIRRGKE